MIQQISELISQEVAQLIETHFSEQMVLEGIKVLNRSHLSISFSKGSPKRFFIVSGILKDTSIYESRISYKKKNDEVVIQSVCNCNLWNTEEHCPHITALFLHFIIQSYNKTNSEISNLSNSPLFNDAVASTEQYGTLITRPQTLLGTAPRSTFSSIKYKLSNNKIINFPNPKTFEGKLIISINSCDNKQSLLIDETHTASKPIFKYQDKDEKIIEEISIFENLHLFNWQNGSLYHLPDDLISLLKRIARKQRLISVDDCFRIASVAIKKDLCLIFDETKDLRNIPTKETKTKISLGKSKKKNHLSFKIESFDEDDNPINTPLPFLLFTYENGLLDSFKTKTYANEFVIALTDTLMFDHPPKLARFLRTSDEKEIIQECIQQIFTLKYIKLYDEEKNIIYSYPTEVFKNLIHAIFTSFGKAAFRFSNYHSDSKIITLEINKSSIFSNITAFYKITSHYDIPILYNQNIIRSWNSSLKFERKNCDINWFNLHLDITKKDLEVIKNANLDSDHVLTSDGLILLDPKQKSILKFIKKYTHFEDSTELDMKDKKRYMLTFQRARIFELFELRKLGLDGALTPEELALCDNLANLEKMPTYPMPEKYQDIAREYQKDGYQWLRFLYENKFGACLADDMGLGKTLQTIIFLESIIHKVDRILIVCPVSLLLNWENEIYKFSTLKPTIYYGGNRILPKESKVILTSYGIMKKEASTTFSENKIDILVLDEIQNLKNIKSIGAFAARKINADFRISLTGTPVENDLSEFYNILDLSVPGVWGDIRFLSTNSTKKSRLLAKRTAKPFILRRTKQQVLKDLPEKTENLVLLDFSDKEKEIYHNKLESIKQELTSTALNKQYTTILKSLLRLRQMCLWQMEEDLLSTKVEYLLENLEQIIEEKHQIIVYSQFTKYLDIIQGKIIEKGWSYTRLDGSQPHKTRNKHVENFQKNGVPIFLVSLKAGGLGLNLTAASYIFLMDPWWNPAVESQAIDRAHRIGQKNNLTVYRLIIKNTVEEKVLVLQNYKKALFKDLMTDDDDKDFYTGKLSMDDFKQLLV